MQFKSQTECAMRFQKLVSFCKCFARKTKMARQGSGTEGGGGGPLSTKRFPVIRFKFKFVLEINTHISGNVTHTLRKWAD